MLNLLCAQSVVSQIVIGTPSLSFSQACASAGFNTYSVSFTFFPTGNLQAGNSFLLEMSDAAGNFSTATVVKTLNNTTSPVATSFQLPTNTAGEGYKLRVRSTAPVAVSPSSVSFPAYYAIHNQPFSINNNTGSVTVCEGSQYTLQVDTDGTAASPLFYPHLKYKWYRNFAEIAGQTGPSLPITAAGNYYVIVDYGSCIMNSYSNIVEISLVSGFELNINSSDGSDIICSGSFKTLTASHQNASYNYQWYRENVAINGATSASYDATLEGTYKLTISVGSCLFESNAVFLELVDLEVGLNTAPVETLIPGLTLQIQGITNAESPTFQWKKNNVDIPGANSDRYTVSDAGNYSLAVTETQGCVASKTASTAVVFPNGYEVVIVPSENYQPCVSTAVDLSINQFNAFTVNGMVDLRNSSAGYGYQWFKNNVAISGANMPQITLAQPTSGTYHLEITLSAQVEPIKSNTLHLVLGGSDPVVINQIGAYCGLTTSVRFESNYTSAGNTYQWYKNEVPIGGETSASYTTSQEGSYHVVVGHNSCSLTSNSIVLSATSGTITLNHPAVALLLPGEEKNITTTTSLSQPTYQWFRNNSSIVGATSSSYIATADGSYTVKAIQGVGCALEAEGTLSLVYPDRINLAIKTGSGYQNCVSNTTTLTVDSFEAESSLGNKTLDPSNPAFSYQWFLNGVAIPGATGNSLPLSNATHNGNYQLRVSLPGFGTVSSNSLAVALALTTPVITAQGSLCDGNSVPIMSSETSPNYGYQWYKNGVLIASATEPILTASESGSYHLVLTQNTCSKTSNTLHLNEQSIAASLNVTAEEIIMPGQVKRLSVTTNAALPTYQWYRNNTIIAGATDSSYEASLLGTYKVEVTQNEGCVLTQIASATLIYPDSFAVTIAPNSGYSPCSSADTVLRIVGFNAQTGSETISIINNNYGYTYQWYKDGVLVLSSEQQTLSITSLAGNGIYELRVVIPNFNLIVSNAVTIVLGLPIRVEITPEFSAICAINGSTRMTSNVSHPDYTYRWFTNTSNLPIGNQPQITITTAGDYYLEVEYMGCVYRSTTASIRTIDASMISLSEGDTFELFDGATKTVTATGGDSYQWFLGTDLVGTGTTYTVLQPGSYTLKARIGNCDIEKPFLVQLKTNNSIVIPNFVSINNDGRNDYWELPEKYTNKESIEIVIYASSGKVLFRTRKYQNNWPNENYTFSKTDPVVYYTISENDVILKRGTITIIE